MQPKNKPENLTPPHKGPSYCPKEKETKVIIEVLKSEEETKVKWHKYPEDKPKCESGYVVIFDDNGYLEAKHCLWIKGMFTGIKNTLVKAWTEMPYVIGGKCL